MDETRRDFHWGMKDAVLGRSARAVALVGVVFCSVVAILLVITHVEKAVSDPINSKALTVLTEQLKSDPKGELLGPAIRDLDLLARRA